MMRTSLLLLLLIFAACSNRDSKDENYTPNVDALTTVAKQAAFLEEIAASDQQVRHFATEQQNKFGYHSAEHKAAITNMVKTDLENLAKIEAFLSKFGHPTLDDHGKNAVEAPWIVIHHSTGNSARERNFEYLYRAWRKEDIRDNAFTFYLNRWYDIKFGERISWNRPFTVYEEVDTLFRALELTETVERVSFALSQHQ